MPGSKTERQLLEDISAKLDKVVAFLAISGRDQNHQIKILRSLDFGWKEIGGLVGLNADASRKRFDSTKNGTASEKPKGPSDKLAKGAK